jgi:Cu/Zn superoxide dismutase
VCTLPQTSANETTISWDIKNCGPGLHGFHIHEKADFSDGCIIIIIEMLSPVI